MVDNQRIIKDALNALTNAKQALLSKDEIVLASISNQTIHNASIFQDKHSLDIAVIMFALSKLIARMQDPNLVKSFSALFDAAIYSLEQNDIEAYDTVMRRFLFHINQLDKGLHLYVQHVLEQARIKKSAKIYDHGISIAQSAQALGISQWELYQYIGKTRMTDIQGESVRNMKKRLAYTRELFRVL
ncbi:MAG: hypothetical protein ACMXYC_03430 [Candidatus Woesearchaeota archaeon]